MLLELRQTHAPVPVPVPVPVPAPVPGASRDNRACLLHPWASRPPCCAPCASRAITRRRLSRRPHSRPRWPVATCWPSRRPAPARPLPSRCRLLQRLVAAPPRPGPRALVLAPTRELAAQTAELLREFAALLLHRPKVALAFGGVSINPQLMALRGGCDVMVATPGRLLDLAGPQRACSSRACNAWCWTRPTACWGRALPRSCSACWPSCRRIASRCCSRPLSRPPCRRWPSSCCAILSTSPSRKRRRRSHSAPFSSIVPSACPRCANCSGAEGWERALVFVASRYTADLVSDKLFRPRFQGRSAAWRTEPGRAA